MSRRSVLIAVLSAMFFLFASGCYHVRVVTVNMPPSDVHQVWMHGFLYGLVGSEISSESVCGNRPVAAVDTYMSFLNFLVGGLTMGIYTPRTVRITCAGTTIQ